MLTHLRITDFALLDDVSIELGPGLTVLTGETGAGKSLLVDAVALIRGGRASAEVVRAGAEEARIEALFILEADAPSTRMLNQTLIEAGIEPAAEELLVRRIIGRNGRGRVHINGSLSTVTMLARLVGDLIDIAGQQEHQTLIDPARHLAILDAYGVTEKLRQSAAQAYARLVEVTQTLADASLDERARAEKEDYLRFQLNELESAGLEAGEDERLREERDRLRSAERLHRVAQQGEEALYAREQAIVGELATLAHDLSEAAGIDSRLDATAQQIEEARTLLEDAADALRRYAAAMQADPARLAVVEERLHLIGHLVRKHGTNLAAAIARQGEITAELAALSRQEERRAVSLEELAAARRSAQQAAVALSQARQRAAQGLGKAATQALADLSMSGAKLKVMVSDRPPREGDDSAFIFEGKRLSQTGWDRAELLLAANLGEELRPLARVASGGELSRIMLALRRVLWRSDVVATYVFDEVDAGIGGTVADVVGRSLNNVAHEKQVLCVTHLPQIAAYAQAHFRVEKHTAAGRTATVIAHLTLSERIEELARMVGGATITSKARAHAEDLIKNARV